MKRRKLILVMSTIFKVRGGIPRFNQMLCMALDELSPSMGLDVVVISQDDTEQDYEDHGRPWRHLRLVPAGGQLGVLTTAFRHCLREHPDLMIIGLLGMTPVGLVCLPFLGEGYAFIVHGVEAWHEPRLTRRLSARRARMVFAVSRHTGQSLTQSTGVPARRVRWLPNTLSPGFEMEPERSEVEDSDDSIRLLTVARLWADEHRKGVDHTIEAVARLGAREPRLRFTIVGKGEDKPRLVGLAESLGVADRIDFRQDLSDEELAEEYRRCSIFVLPSGQEGFGIVFLEAMRFSKPCIGGNEGGTPEVIAEGESGFLVPFGDVDALVRRLETLLADPELRRSMGIAGRRRLLDHFTYEAFRSRLADHLEGFFDPS